MDINTFADTMTAQIKTAGWEGMEPHLHTVNLPDGWQEMIRPFFDDLKGKPLESSVKSPNDFTREELTWPQGDLPSPLDEVQHILVIEYAESDGEDKESGRFTFPLLEIDGDWKITVVG